MKYYVDILYMIVNGVIISNDKNKNIIEMRLKNIVKTANGLSNVKKTSSGLKSVKGAGLRILK